MTTYKSSAPKIKNLPQLIPILLFLIFATYWSLTAAIDIPTFHLDGAFQAASGLFRLNSGQTPGKDFFPYLGIGPLLSLYPAFKIMGGDLAASVFSAHFMTLVFGWISVSVLWQLIFHPKSPISSFAAGAFLFIAPIFISDFFSLPNSLEFISNPGNSLRPIRVAAPYMLTIFFYFLIVKINISHFKSSVAGLATGIIMLWSNDFAIPSAGLFSIFFCVYLYIIDNSVLKKSLLIYFCTATFSWILVVTLATFGHPLELYEYNFLDVARDQFWFFGPYGESTRIFKFSQLSRLISQENIFPLSVLTLVFIAAIKTKKIEHALLAWIGLVLFSGGSLASLGGHLGGYFEGFYYWGIMTTFIILLRLTCLAVHKVANYDIFYKKLIHSLCAVAAIVLLVETTFTWLEYKRTLTTAQNDARKFYVTELGGYIGLEWQEYIDLARKNKDKIVTEEYWGIWSSLNRKFPAWPVDSVIHALGNVRGIAKTAIKDSDIITSTRHATSPTWQPWSLSQNFWFYDELILGWEPKMLSPTTVIWERNTTPRALIDITCDISEDKQKFILKPGAEGFYRVNVSYSTKEAGRYLLMLRNNISYGSDANGYVSVNPYNSNVTFPAQITNNSGNIFDSKIFGSNTSALSIQSCTAQKIAIDYPEILHIFKPDDFYLTDGNWIHGVARQWAGFFVPNKDEYSTQYKVGRYVKFENGEFRKINDIIPHGLYLNVYVNGEVLNQEVIGIPSKFSVVDNFQG